jgi:mono/diheme cytochrome c family protein
MYHARTMSREIQAVLTLAALFCVGGVAQAADVQAGRSAAQSKCAQCHEADDWEGEDAGSLESLIRDIVAGKVKHKGKLELSAAEISNIAAYWGQGKN